MKIENMDFPFSTEDFIACQEQALGRPATETEREVLTVWVPLLNAAADYAQQTYADNMEKLEELIASAGTQPVKRFMQSMKWWMERVYTETHGDE